MKRTKVNEKLNCVRKMPELWHAVGDGEFDITNSEVVDWLINQPDVLSVMWDLIRSRIAIGSNPLIVYDPKRGSWKGIDYKG